MSATLRAPMPYMGGKSRCAPLIWERLGDPENTVEPFFGSGAVLLGRPGWNPEWGGWADGRNRTETVNDIDCYVANFFRALREAPDEVASYCDRQVNEADLHAAHDWLLSRAEFRERMHHEIDFYDAKIAGLWCWGLCQWIGSGWCSEDCYRDGATREAKQKLPHLGPGRGVHRPSQKLPHLGDPGMEDRRGLYAYFAALADRLRHVRVCCGDWTRVLGPSPTTHLGLTGVILDPPYLTDEGNRQAGLYSCDDGQVAHAVRAWCLEHGDDPLLRIVLAGYRGEHDELEAHGWERVGWKAHGGYGSQGDGRGRANAGRESLWFSPRCLRAEQPHSQRSLLDLDPQ